MSEELRKPSPSEANDALSVVKNAQKILDDNKDKIQTAVMQSMSNERASREPIPSEAMNKLFNPEPLIVNTSIGSVTIRPMVAYDINVFKLINSPFYHIIMGDNEIASDALFATEEESYQMIYQFTHPIKDVYHLFKKGKEIFKNTVLEEVAFTYNPQDAALLVESIIKHVFSVSEAKISFNAPEPELGDKKKLIPPTQ